jgi:fructose/tagatose bisphosphate aldolase
VSLQGVLDAAEETRSPIVIGFNGEFLSGPERLAAERLAIYGGAGKAAAEAASVPCGFIFNECTRDEWTLRAIDEGFNLVMPIDGDNDYESYVRRTAGITERAHKKGVAVEGELGELPDRFDAAHASSATDPDQAADFFERTGVDLLAVSVGNVHCHTGDGMALAFKMKKTDQVVACFFGDGATGEGAFHEGINMAAIWNLPVINLCENNLYGASTDIRDMMRLDRVADRASVAKPPWHEPSCPAIRGTISTLKVGFPGSCWRNRSPPSASFQSNRSRSPSDRNKLRRSTPRTVTWYIAPSNSTHPDFPQRFYGPFTKNGPLEWTQVYSGYGWPDPGLNATGSSAPACLWGR